MGYWIALIAHIQVPRQSTWGIDFDGHYRVETLRRRFAGHLWLGAIGPGLDKGPQDPRHRPAYQNGAAEVAKVWAPTIILFDQLFHGSERWIVFRAKMIPSWEISASTPILPVKKFHPANASFQSCCLRDLFQPFALCKTPSKKKKMESKFR